MSQKGNRANIVLNIQEVVKILCPECKEALKRLIASKIADKIVRG